LIGFLKPYGLTEQPGETPQVIPPMNWCMGSKVLLPIEFQVKTFRTTMQLGMDLDEAHKQRVMQLNELDEIRQDALQENHTHSRSKG
jgi:hypothetical protein